MLTYFEVQNEDMKKWGTCICEINGTVLSRILSYPQWKYNLVVHTASWTGETHKESGENIYNVTLGSKKLPPGYNYHMDFIIIPRDDYNVMDDYKFKMNLDT